MKNSLTMTSLLWWPFQAGEQDVSLQVGLFASFACLGLNRVIETPTISACLWALDQNSVVLVVPGCSIAILRGNLLTSVG